MALTDAGRILLLTPVKNAVRRIYPTFGVGSVGGINNVQREGTGGDTGLTPIRYIGSAWFDLDTTTDAKLQVDFSGLVRRFEVEGPPNLSDAVIINGLDMKDSDDVSWFTGTFANTFEFYSDGTLTINTVELALE